MESWAFRKFFIIQALFSILTLTACTASVMPSKDNYSDKYNTHIKQVAQTAETLSSWHITGAIAAKKNKKAWSASITWEQLDKNNYLIHLFGPLGGGSITLEKKNGLLTYQDGHKIEQSPHEEALIYQQTHVSLPVHQLFYWVRGLKAPGDAQLIQRDSEGHLVQLRQYGYTVYYSNYLLINDIALPTKIRLETPGGLVKVVIKQWYIHA
jgi:outer membrane lipoprotein LolB